MALELKLIPLGVCVAPPDHCARGRGDDDLGCQRGVPFANGKEFKTRVGRIPKQSGMNAWLGNEHLTGLTASWLLGPLGYVIFLQAVDFVLFSWGVPQISPKLWSSDQP